MWNSLTKYHPRIGFTYMPSVKSRVPCEAGGYLVRTNAAGFRSDHEFARERSAGKLRAVLFGDSQTAGNSCSNGERYSDVVTSLVPDLEVFNYGLPSTGTDQHYLTYQDCVDVEHDLVIIGMHVKIIGRVAQRFVHWQDKSGADVVYAKPYYSLEHGRLSLHHVPVPKEPIPTASLPAELAPHVYWGVPFAALRKVATHLGVRDFLQKAVKFQPVPEYSSPNHPTWLLLRKILELWIQECKTPVLLFLIPMWPYIEGSADPTGYQARFRELAHDTGCHLHDPLPDLWQYPQEERRSFRFKTDSHFTPRGHRALAASLATAIERIRGNQRTGGSTDDPLAG